MTRSDKEEKILAVRIPIEDYERLEKFLDKFSAGDTFSKQVRELIHWLVSRLRA